MPDAHLGYGLPIGGVLATENAVIPYAVGVDIACRMKLSVFDIPADAHRSGCNDQLVNVARSARRVFGIGGEFKQAAASTTCWTRTGRSRRSPSASSTRPAASSARAAAGNHFVEFGIAHARQAPTWACEPGEYLALLSHSGSRGAGATVADFYSQAARWTCTRSCRRSCERLAWLDLDSEAGPGILGRDEPDGQVRRRQPRVIHRKIAQGTRRDGRSPAWRTTTTSPGRKTHDGKRADRPPQRRDAGGRGRARRHPRLDGDARVRRARQGRAPSRSNPPPTAPAGG